MLSRSVFPVVGRQQLTARNTVSSCSTRLFSSVLVASVSQRKTSAVVKTAKFLAATTTTTTTTRGLFTQELKKEWMTPKKEGDQVPDVEFITRVRIESNDPNPFTWKKRTTADLFAGKRVVLFALPGAFTPTCSASHLPGYEAAYDEMKSLGIDEVYCLSVNDAFVMRKWGLDQGLLEDKTPGSFGFYKVKLIPDGAAQFTRGMGMSTLWDTNRGFGERTWRYSMVVHNGKIEKMFVEQPKLQNSGPDPYQVSDAGTILLYLKSKATK